MESCWVIGSLTVDQFKFVASLTKVLHGTATSKQNHLQREKLEYFQIFLVSYFLLPFRQYV